MSEGKIYPVHPHVLTDATLDEEEYQSLYQASIDNPEQFWSDHGRRIDWIRPYSRIKNTSFEKGKVAIKWYQDGVLNVCANCIDRHLPENFNRTAIIFEGDTPDESRHISYAELHEQVSRLGNVLKSLGVRKGCVVTIYMPMIPEAAFAMLACARIGAIHSVVFGGFSPDALAGRIRDCRSEFVITADEGVRGGKTIPLKSNVDQAIERLEDKAVKKTIVVKRTGGEINWFPERDIWFEEIMEEASVDCPPEPMNAEDPLFILYTSGSTGQPKGVLHTSGGYLVYVSLTHEFVFDLKRSDVFWCTADVGWITGHSYIVYGPLANCATTVMFEGVPNYPDYSRFWQIVDEHKVTIFYTAPTAIRALMREGDDPLNNTDRTSLRLLGSVGEPINPEAWEWYYHKVGLGRCPIVDTWWQTETGGAMITPLPGATVLKPGSATRPFFGIMPALVDGEGNVLSGVAEGNLVLLDSWPGQMRTIYGDHERFEQTYFSTFENMYFTGDGARRDEDGYYWITGRVDDVLNVSGHRMGTAEIESSLVAHPKVAEAAVVGFPHDVKGQGIYVYVTLLAGVEASDELRTEIRNWVRKDIGPIASPDRIHWAPGLPKTRSGKIMRRILRKIAANDYATLGDTSTLADPSVVKELIENRIKD